MNRNECSSSTYFGGIQLRVLMTNKMVVAGDEHTDNGSMDGSGLKPYFTNIKRLGKEDLVEIQITYGYGNDWGIGSGLPFIITQL